MDLDNVYVADIETDSLLETLTKMHVMSLGFKVNGEWRIKSTNKREDVIKVFCNPKNTIVMHNGRRFDVPAIEKIFGIKVTACVVDSLSIAWCVEPNRIKEGRKYGLESYGEEFGVPKPKIGSDEWVGISQEKIDIINYYESLEK